MLTYPTVVAPTIFPKTAQIAASLKLRPSTRVPMDPTIILFVARVMLNHMRSMCNEVDGVTGCLSSRETGSMPRDSAPLKHAFTFSHLDFGGVSRTGSLISLVGEFSSSNWLTLCREGEAFSTSSGLILFDAEGEVVEDPSAYSTTPLSTTNRDPTSNTRIHLVKKVYPPILSSANGHKLVHEKGTLEWKCTEERDTTKARETAASA